MDNQEKLIASRGSLQQCQWFSLQGDLMRAFSVKNKRGKILAIGAVPGVTPGFCLLHAKRYEHDLDLVSAIHKLTGIEPRLGHSR